MLECRHFSSAVKALEASQAHPCRKVLLLSPLSHHPSVNGWGLCDWPGQVSIDPACPTLTSLASCGPTPPEESTEQITTIRQIKSDPAFCHSSSSNGSGHIHLFIAFCVHTVWCVPFLFPLQCAGYYVNTKFMNAIEEGKWKKKHFLWLPLFLCRLPRWCCENCWAGVQT